MSRLSRQLDLPALPDALRPTRRLRALDFPLRAASTPRGVDPAPVKKRTGGDYDTDWARRPLASGVRRVITRGPLRLATMLAARAASVT